MRDPNFRRTVVLLSAHGDDGAIGLVLNRPMSKQLGELNAEFAASLLAKVPVYQEAPSSGSAHPRGLAGGSVGRRFQTPFQALMWTRRRRCRNEADVQLRAFPRLFGWTKGQLENELKQNQPGSSLR